MDGFRRINKVLTEGEVLSKKAIIAISLAYLAEALQFAVLIFLKPKPNNTQLFLTPSYVIDCTFFIANATLATLLY